MKKTTAAHTRFSALSQGRSKRSARSSSLRFAYALTLPTFVVMAVVVVLPLFTVLWLSLSDATVVTQGELSGFGNFQYLLQTDPYFWRIVRNTVVWAVVIVAVEFVAGFAIALLLNQALRFRGVFRALILLPWVVPSVTASLIWLTLYADDGSINSLVGVVGIAPQAWLTDPKLATASLMAVTIWKTIPFVIVALLAGLQTIPRELYEAAQLDGAGAINRFRYVTFPVMWPLSSLIIMLSLIWRAGDFDIINLLTGGGPGNRTHLLSTYAYQQTTTSLAAGRGAAVAVVGVLLLTLLIPFFVRKVVRQSL